MKRIQFLLLSWLLVGMSSMQVAEACTGISLTAKDGSHIYSRTIEWGGSELDSRYVIVPRGHEQQSYTPAGRDGMRFRAKYGYVGLAVEQEEFVTEGLNEAGLSAGLFYFPGYGQYEEFDLDKCASTISDFQLVSWMLGQFATVDEVRRAIDTVHIVLIDPRSSTVHWRIADASGKELVLEITEGKPHFYENSVGVLTNSPGFEWQMTNLNNYVNLHPGNVAGHSLGNVSVAPFGAGSGFWGIPGDVTPPSRFVRAAFYKTTAPQCDSAMQAVVQCFQILNNFDIPIGIEYAVDETPADIPSATQWTSATDVTNRIIYYRTMYNSTIRRIDLKKISFDKIQYKAVFLDEKKEQPIIDISL